ncbi:MAG: EAL domain-containing protein [Vicinamibacterales bacterium]|nr:EAL domain-containing protein [Vicinamibacterales bacterium]
MGFRRHRTSILTCAASAIWAGALLGFAYWPPPDQVVQYSALILATILTRALAAQRAAAKDWATAPPSFIVDFASLLLLGPNATMLVASAGVVTQGLADSRRQDLPRRMFLNLATAMVAIQGAGVVYRLLGGTLGHFIWPNQGLPIAAAVISYCFVNSASEEIVFPFFTKQPSRRSWPKSILRGCPSYFIGAGLAVGLVEVVDHRMWAVLPVAAVPLFFAYRAYGANLNQLEEEHRRKEVIDSLDQGMSIVDSDGEITLWNDATERILGCPRDQALERTLVEAVPALAKTGLPRALSDALADLKPRTLSHLQLPSAAGTRILNVRILPVVGGVTLLWHDVTERTRAEHSLKRSEERLALAAEGANDGLWEWDLRSQEFYYSARWRALLGLSASACIGRPEDWTERVHAEDITSLKDALKAHLSGKTEHFYHEHRIRHEDGTYRRFLCCGLAVRGEGRRPARIGGSLTDTTERTLAQERLQSAGFRDALTGLSNRSVFVEHLGRRLEELKTQKGAKRFAVLYLDLDRFKVVNDSLGHLVGDELLVAVSRRLESCLQPGDALARLGGDEFAILLNDLGDENQANAMSLRIQESLSAPFSIGGREVFTSASIGIAFGWGQYDNPDEIMRDADTAMYHAKSRGKARHELFDADMHARELDRLGFENDLRHAVSHNAFEVHYQPIVSLASGRCIGFESLVRWTRDGKSISPATFIPIAEELGIIEPLGTWVLQQACTTFADWQRRFPGAGLECITVNVSSRQLMQQNFLRIVEQAVQSSQLKTCDLRLEITETALMDSTNVAAELLRQLRDFGVKIYLDDFGTGYSSLSHLHKLPVDALKIDRSFVKSLLLPDRPAIVESILALARTLNTSVVAEGVESEVQAQRLERLGCTHAQGFLFSRPLSASAAEEILAANQPLGPQKTQPSVRTAATRNDAAYCVTQ